MDIENALTECPDAVVVPDDHRDSNRNDSDDEGEGEEAAMSSSTWGAEREREEGAEGGAAIRPLPWTVATAAIVT